MGGHLSPDAAFIYDFAFPDQTPGTTPGQTGLSGLTALSVVEELVKRQGQGIALDPSTVDWNAQALTRPRLTLATPLPGQSSLSGPPARACAKHRESVQDQVLHRANRGRR